MTIRKRNALLALLAIAATCGTAPDEQPTEAANRVDLYGDPLPEGAITAPGHDSPPRRSRLPGGDGRRPVHHHGSSGQA